jgi:hypothetical protein
MARWCRTSSRGLLACGRHGLVRQELARLHARDPAMLDHRQAAGAAAALAVAQGVAPRAVDVPALQAELLKQGVFLRSGRRRARPRPPPEPAPGNAPGAAHGRHTGHPRSDTVSALEARHRGAALLRRGPARAHAHRAVAHHRHPAPDRDAAGHDAGRRSAC